MKYLQKCPRNLVTTINEKKKYSNFEENGPINPKLKYRKALKSMLCGKFGMVTIQVTHTGDQELSNLSRRCLDKIRRVDISLFVYFLAF